MSIECDNDKLGTGDCIQCYHYGGCEKYHSDDDDDHTEKSPEPWFERHDWIAPDDGVHRPVARESAWTIDGLRIVRLEEDFLGEIRLHADFLSFKSNCAEQHVLAIQEAIKTMKEWEAKK